MADTAAQVRRVVSRLRARGFTVHEVAGWETRGTTAMTTRGRIEHHTATSRSAAGDAPTLRVVTYGHGSLRNSLSRWYVSRSGVIYLVALRTSWHAGAGGKGTNTTLSGTEAEHSGTTGEPWGTRSLAAQEAISQEENREFGFGFSRVWEHKEHAPARKVDRIGMSGSSWRARLGRATPAPTPTPPPTPAPAPPAPTLEDDMLVRIDNTSTVYHVVGDGLIPLSSATQAAVIAGDDWRDNVKLLTREQASVFHVVRLHPIDGRPVGPMETADRIGQGLSATGSTPLGLGRWSGPVVRWARRTQGAKLEEHERP